MTASATTLTNVHGLGALTAGKILARVGNIGRFRSAAAFASYTGTAPIEVSSGDTVRHRLSRAGDRQLNCCLHVMAITQVRQHTPGRAYYLRKRSEGKRHNEAMRCLKRRLSDLVYRRLIHDADTQKGTVNLSSPRAIFAGSPPRFTRSRVTYEAYAVSRTSTRPQVDSASCPVRPVCPRPHRARVCILDLPPWESVLAVAGGGFGRPLEAAKQ